MLKKLPELIFERSQMPILLSNLLGSASSQSQLGNLDVRPTKAAEMAIAYSADESVGSSIGCCNCWADNSWFGRDRLGLALLDYR